MQIRENVPLAPMTTLGVGGPARYFGQAHCLDDVREAVAYAGKKTLPLFVLGGGSNLVISDSGWPGLVVRIGITGIERRSGSSIFEVGAGEEWDKFVACAVSQNCAGIECLSGIPGSTERGRFIVLRVDFSLSVDGQPRINYADLKRYFAGRDEPPTLAATREAVRQIRASKGMLITPGDEDCSSAGSFFKNPVLPDAEYESLRQRAQERGLQIPSYPALNAYRKISAAWLVENSGFHKGYRRGPVGISRKHALAIVNRGGAKAADIIALKEEIQQGVGETWGIQLHPEPVFVGY
jgi:UDP-N-acetylmuramate dehydrogenase